MCANFRRTQRRYFIQIRLLLNFGHLDDFQAIWAWPARVQHLKT